MPKFLKSVLVSVLITQAFLLQPLCALEVLPVIPFRPPLFADGARTYTYDYENRLISATDGTTTIEFTYDAFGRRTQKRNNTSNAITNFTYDGDQIIEELDATNTLQTKYYYGTGIDEVIKMDRGGDSYWYYHDGLGSVTDLKQQSTSLTQETYAYDVFGKPTIRDLYGNVITQSQFGNPFMFNGILPR